MSIQINEIVQQIVNRVSYRDNNNSPSYSKTVNLNVSLPTTSEKHRSTECRLSYKTLNSHGLICGYKCDNGKNANMPNKDFNSPNDCSEWITIE